MTPEFKKMIRPLAMILTAVFFFIFMATSFLNMTASAYGFSATESLASGYECLDFLDDYITEGDAAFFYSLAGFILILMLIATVYFIAAGLMELLAMKGKKLLTDEASAKLDKITELVFAGNAMASILTFICLLIFGLSNGESEQGVSVSICVGIGAILLMIFSVLLYAAYYLLVKRDILAGKTPAAEETVSEEASETSDNE